MNDAVKKLLEAMARIPQEVAELTTYNTLIAAAIRLGLEAVYDKPVFDSRQLSIYDSRYTASGVVLYVRDAVDGKEYTVEIQQHKAAEVKRFNHNNEVPR